MDDLFLHWSKGDPRPVLRTVEDIANRVEYLNGIATREAKLEEVFLVCVLLGDSFGSPQ